MKFSLLLGAPFVISLNPLRAALVTAFSLATLVALATANTEPALADAASTVENRSAEEKEAAATSPLKEVKITLDQVVATNERLMGDAHTKERRDELRRIIEPRFDFDEMAKRSLGPEWPKRTKEEQAEFSRIFSKLLASTYLDRVETATRDMLTVDKEKVQYPRAIVRTTVTSRGESFPIDYKLQFVEGEWRVYDVVVENIGLVANYRSEFAGIIRKEEFSGLMQKLRDKAG